MTALPPSSPAASPQAPPVSRWFGRAGLLALSLAVAGPSMCGTVFVFPATVHHVLGLAGGLQFFLAGVVATCVAPLVVRFSRRRGLLSDRLNGRLARVASRVSLAAVVAFLMLVMVGVSGCRESFSSERTLSTSPGPGAAAIAIRDPVPRYQRYFSSRFTTPHLGAYDRSWYIEEASFGSGREQFLAALREATGSFAQVDVFLLAHGNWYRSWVAELAPEQRARIRLVYNTAARGQSEAAQWLALDVRNYVAHEGANLSPLFYVHFLPLYLHGEPLDIAVETANQRTIDELTTTVTARVVMAMGRMFARYAPASRLIRGTNAALYRRGGD